MLTGTRSTLVLAAHLDRQLASRTGLSVSQFAIDNECSTRTVYRNLGFLRDRFGVPVVYDPVSYVWRYPQGFPGVFSPWARDRVI